MRVDYKGVEVGVFRADLLVEKRVIVEIKAVAQLNKIHEMQLVNYLQTTHIDNGVLVNFGGDEFEVNRKFRIRK